MGGGEDVKEKPTPTESWTNLTARASIHARDRFIKEMKHLDIRKNEISLGSTNDKDEGGKVEAKDKKGDTPSFTSESEDKKEVVDGFMTRTESLLGISGEGAVIAQCITFAFTQYFC
jgi:hypothetical protein